MLDHHIKLGTGREFYAYDGIVGIDEEFNVTSGSDDHVIFAKPCHLDQWTIGDRLALADMMIERWQGFRTASLKPLEALEG